MPFISYFLTSIIAFSGIIMGIIIALITDEELKPGKKYFILLQKMILIVMIFSLLFFFELSLPLVIIASLIFAVFIHFYKEKIPSKLIFPFLAIIFTLSYGTEKLFLIESSLIFLYGLPTGSLAVYFKKKSYLIILENISFIVIAVALFLITL